VSAAERRSIVNSEKHTQIWISDLLGIIPSITGKIELVYEGEQEGPFQVAMNLLDKSIRSQFIQYFPNPENLKKRAARKGESPQTVDNPYKSITNWFDKGNHINLSFGTSDREKINLLYKVDGLHSLVKKHFPHTNEKETALLMEFVLHGLSSYSLISKKIFETSVEFKDLMGSMLNIQSSSYDDDFEDEDFR
jgi:magnesium chelatase subunit I